MQIPFFKNTEWREDKTKEENEIEKSGIKTQ